MAAPVLTLTPVTVPTNQLIDLSALTGGVVRTTDLAGYTGADFAWFQNNGQYLKQSGGNQCLPYVIGNATHGGGYSAQTGNPINIGAGDINDADAGRNSPTNWQGFTCPGIGDGMQFRPIANRQLKHMLVGLSVPDSGVGHYIVKASLSDNSAPPVSFDCTPGPQYGEGRNWFTVDWRNGDPNGADGVMTLEISKKDAGAGYFYIQLAYITVPVNEVMPKGLGKMMAYTGHFGGANL